VDKLEAESRIQKMDRAALIICKFKNGCYGNLEKDKHCLLTAESVRKMNVNILGSGLTEGENYIFVSPHLTHETMINNCNRIHTRGQIQLLF